MDSFRKYLRLCWFNADPISLPRSVSFLKNNLIIFFVIQFLIQANLTDDPIESFYEVNLEMLITSLFVWIMLYCNKALFAFVQILSAFIFSTNAISCLIIPVLAWLTITEHSLSYYSLIVLLVWEYLIVSCIIKHTLTLNWLASTIMSLFYLVITYAGSVTLGQLL